MARRPGGVERELAVILTPGVEVEIGVRRAHVDDAALALGQVLDGEVWEALIALQRLARQADALAGLRLVLGHDRANQRGHGIVRVEPERRVDGLLGRVELPRLVVGDPEAGRRAGQPGIDDGRFEHPLDRFLRASLSEGEIAPQQQRVG